MNLATSRLLYFGSGRISLLVTTLLLGMIYPRLTRSLGPVFRPTLFPVLDTDGIQRSPDDVVTHAGNILDATAAHQDDGRNVPEGYVPHPV